MSISALESALGVRVAFSTDELLAEAAYGSPLIAGEVRCHGGFDVDGRYQSPRTLNRSPAILAWQKRLASEGGSLIEIEQALIPPQYPSVEQARLLLTSGVREPIVRTLTVISILEGFGAIIRDVRVPELSSLVVEPIEGRAIAHLEGLFEAHARDEAGYKDQGGHKQMWEAARDLALDNPKIPSDVFMRLMGDRGQARAAEPIFPQLDRKLYRMLAMMAQVLVIEVFATRTFDWGEAVLSDASISSKAKEAGAMVRFIRSDESPHVEYLRTALSELRQLTLRTVDGALLPGRTVVDGLMHHVLARAMQGRPPQQRDDMQASIARAIQSGQARPSLVSELDALETPFTPPARTGFEPDAVSGAVSEPAT